MKKRILLILLVAVMALSFAACKASGEYFSGESTEALSGGESTDPETTEAPQITDEELFMQFLKGEIPAALEENPVYDLSYAGVTRSNGETVYAFTGPTLTLAQLQEAVQSTISADANPSASYGILETGAGKKLLAVKFESLGIYSPEDDSHAVFFFAVSGDTLALTYAYDSWVRSQVTLGGDGVTSGSGSAGAGDSYAWGGYFDETGHYRQIYMLETLTNQWVAMYDYTDFGSDVDWSAGSTLYLLDTAQGAFYAYTAEPGVDSGKLAVLIRHLEEEGRQAIEDAQAAIAGAYSENGVASDPVIPYDNWSPVNF